MAVSVAKASAWLVRNGAKSRKELADYSDDEILDMYYALSDDGE